MGVSSILSLINVRSPLMDSINVHSTRPYVDVSCIVISFDKFDFFVQVISVNLVQTLKTICRPRNTEKMVKMSSQVIAAAWWRFEQGFLQHCLTEMSWQISYQITVMGKQNYYLSKFYNLIFQISKMCPLVSASVKHPPHGPFALVFSSHLNTIHPMHPVALNTGFEYVRNFKNSWNGKVAPLKWCHHENCL